MAAAAAHHRAAAAAAALLAVVAATALLLADAAAGHRERQGPQAAMAVCVKAHGVEAGETCASVARNWGMSDRAFANLNPNVTCAALFPGQWLCVDGAVIG